MDKPISSDSTATTCPYCGVGCGVTVRTNTKQLVTVKGDTQHPANQGRLCVKGTKLAETLVPTDRLLSPKLHGETTSWDIALDELANKFQTAIAEHGPDSVAFYLSGQLLTEDYYVANKLMKGFIGSSNVDTNSRLCMSSAVTAYKRAFGEDVVPCDYEDLEHCDLLVLVGSNAAWTHPVIFQRIRAAKANRGMKVVSIDPRRTATNDIVDLHLPIKSDSDLALFNGLLTHLVKKDVIARAFVRSHTQGLKECLTASSLTLSQVSDITGVARQDLATFYDWFTRTRRTVTMYSQGVNQSTQGTNKANAIINCHLLTGRIGKPGTGPFSITGQPNAMGGREVGGLANQLAAHQDFDAPSIDRVSRFWQAPNIARAPGLKAVDLFHAMGEGKIKAIWIMGTNPAVSLPDSQAVHKALAACPFVVVSDCIEHTDTNEFADLLLPAAAWGEKNGTVTNSERCISRQRSFLPLPGEAKPDWKIICEAAHRLGYAEAFKYDSPRDIFVEHAALSGFENRGERVFDISPLASLTVPDYDALEPQSWPAHARPFAANQFSTASGRANFIPTPLAPAVNEEAHYPLQVNSGRLRDQWHTMTRTGVAPALFQHQASPQVLIHPKDAKTQGLTSGCLVELANDFGKFRGICKISKDVIQGEVFAPIHWTRQFSHQAVVNALYAPHTDPYSGQPQSKKTSASIAVVSVNQWLRVLMPNQIQPELLQQIDFEYWSLSTTNIGYCYDIAASAEAASNFTEQLQAAHSGCTHYEFVDHCATPPTKRSMGTVGQSSVWVAYSAATFPDLPSLGAMVRLQTPQPASWLNLSLLNSKGIDDSPQVCTCFEVSRNKILNCIGAGASTLAELSQSLQCGSNCGSCVPELNALLASAPQGKMLAAGD